ncbi:MAG TPA: NADP-dependent malic enzyme [Burkholderiaceae bacterium]|nr:NADP-dependent malic enzyme [Burkholderiaceae bacterium]HQR69986.1 NADP-dependent malic enzyme [Burkholderiaceae bacterium]
MSDTLRDAALEYHRLPTHGKISVVPTKAMVTQRDLSLAYSPGVAEACNEIVRDPREAHTLTARGNLVAVVTNGTAVLGLGNIGPLAGKPVMEGKGCLFKKFAGIDVFDIELDEKDPDKLVDIIAALEPTFGGINLEDIKAPECFYIERRLRERMKIPVFHDDQHGTAIVAAAAVLNGLRCVSKDIGQAKLVCSGAGAAAIACLDLLVRLGLRRENILVADSKGVLYSGRSGLDESKARYARDTSARTLADAMPGADIFMGLSGPGVLSGAMVKGMAPRPLILAMANPTPEIMPEEARAARPDVIIGTGRSDYPNQVNNVLCFPFIFRGALDVGATTINEEMKLATVRALADLTHAEIPDEVASAYGAEGLRFGPEYLIPKPFDPRLIERIAPAVAQAAMDSGVAARPMPDIEAYRASLRRFVYQSGSTMEPVFAAAKKAPKRLIYAEGEEERVLRAAQAVVDEGIAQPILIGRPDVISARIERYGLRLRLGHDVDCVNVLDDTRFRETWTGYYELGKRKGVTKSLAQTEIRTRTTLIGAMLVRKGYADAMLCGTVGGYADHLRYVRTAIGLRSGVHTFAAMQLLVLPNRHLFICDTHVNPDPTAAQVAEMTMLAADAVKRFGITPRVALLSHSNFGSSELPSAVKMREALALIQARNPDFPVDGEMQADTALSQVVLEASMPDSPLSAEANLLIMPNVDAANITYNALRITAGGGITIGAILLGAAQPVHILTPASTVRRIINMSAVAVVDAAAARG